MKMKCILMIAASILAFHAFAESGDGNHVNDFTEACLSSTNLDHPICECSAKKAKKELSSNGFAFLVASMSGDEAKTAMLRSKLEISEAMAAGMFMTKAPAQCAMEMEGN